MRIEFKNKKSEFNDSINLIIKNVDKKENDIKNVIENLNPVENMNLIFKCNLKYNSLAFSSSQFK